MSQTISGSMGPAVVGVVTAQNDGPGAVSEASGPPPLGTTDDADFKKRSQTDAPLDGFDAPIPKSTLYAGSTGDDVRALQTLLEKLGELDPASAVDESGTLGPKTASALHDFQAKHDPDAAMLYGPTTRAALEVAVNEQTYPDLPGRDLGPGSSGADVAKLQSALTRTGFMTADAAASEPGQFGAKTEAAIRNAQSQLTLMQTGSFGGQVRYSLEQLLSVGKPGAKPLNLVQPSALEPSEMPDQTYGLYGYQGPVSGASMSPSGVFQGYDGDCWFDSAVGVIAKNDPDALAKMVQDNGNGTYTFTFHEPNAKGGYTPVPVTVDSNLYAMEHTVKGSGQPELYPIFDKDRHGGHSNDGTMKALFMPLLEKAFAQFRGGSYAKLEGGFGAMGMAPILGRPAYNIMFDSTMPPDRLWGILQKGTATNTPMTLGTLSTTKKEDRDAAGLVGGHAYMVTGIKEQDGKKLVEVRNPWGYRGVGTDTSVESADVEVPLETVLKLFHDVSACPAPGVDIGINTPDADVY